MSAGKMTRVAALGMTGAAERERSGGRPGARTLTAGPLPRMPRELGLPEPQEEDVNVGKLSEDARRRLERETDVNLTTVSDHYSIACVHVQQALHERARAKGSGQWFLELLVDVLAGTLLPGLAKSALRQAADAFASTAWGETLELGKLVAENKQVGALVGQAVSKVNGAMKGAFKAMAPKSSAAEEFVRRLGSTARNSIAELRKDLDGLDDEQLMAVCLAYSPATNDDVALADRIMDLALKFRAEVEPIGEHETVAGNMAYTHDRTKTLVYIVRGDGSEALALVTRYSNTLRATGQEDGAARYRLEEWISADMKDVALAKMGETEIPRLAESDVWERGTSDQPGVRVR